jgi:hexosaminidase
MSLSGCASRDQHLVWRGWNSNVFTGGLMRFGVMAASCFLTFAVVGISAQSAPTCADLKLVPTPRECKAVRSVAIGTGGLRLVAGGNSEDRFAAKDLEDSLKELGIPIGKAKGLLVRFERVSSERAKEISETADEAYEIRPVGAHELVVRAGTAEGIFYGAQTVKQLVRGHGKDAVLLVPTIRDWPAMAHRGISDDWSRGPLPNMEFLKREIRTLAAYKYNIFSPYFEHTFAYASTPVAAFPGGAMTPEEGKQLVEYAAKYHITIIPEQEAFGHLHHVLKFEEYSKLGETPHGAVLAPGDAGSLPQIGEWFGELAKVFPGPYAHIGADETDQLGLGRTHDQVAQQGLGKVYLDFLGKIHEQLAPLHKRLLFWGDIAENSPELVGTLPKDMIAVSWHYDAKPDFTKNLEPFLKSGLETWVATGVNNWNRVYPNNNEALGNIENFVRDGQKLGAKGLLNTVWNDDGEGIFDENWFGLLFGAASSWQPGESSAEKFTASFGQAFHGDATGKISQAQQEMMAAHAVLRKADLEDAEDRYFWADPYSPEGKEISAKLLPVVSELRLHAEKAITLLAQARAAGKLENQEALDALELGARRIDFIGSKFQFAQECADLYAKAREAAASGDKNRWNEVGEAMYTIGSNNGRFEDIRDGYAQLGQLFKNAWLKDNRPYWLSVNMARYDRAAQLWVDRSMKWQSVIHNWHNTHTLPPAEQVGLPAGSSPAH